MPGRLRGHGAGPEEPGYASKAGWFSSLDPRAKLVGVVAFVAACSLLTDPGLLLTALAASLALAAASGVRRRSLARTYASALPFILLASFSVFLVRGVDDGLLMLTRTSACVVPLLVLAIGTDTFDLFSGLRRLKVPGTITALLMLTHRYISIMSEELARMRIARRARGFAGGTSLFDRYGLQVISNTAGMIFVRSSGRAERVYDALKARGFDDELRGWRESRMALPDAAFMSVFVGGAAAFVLAQAGMIA